jgi:hypothetical protein
VVEHQNVRQRLEAVREVAGHVDRGEIAVADVLAERLAGVAVERDHSSQPLQADEEIALPLVVMEAANRPLTRERHVRLAQRFRQASCPCNLGEPAALVVEAPKANDLRPVHWLLAPCLRTKSFTS